MRIKDEGFDKFINEYGQSNDYSLNDVFWTCSTMLSTRYYISFLYSTSSFSSLYLSGSKLSHKRILLFTNNDNPHRNSPALQVIINYSLITRSIFNKQRQAKTKAKVHFCCM